jgi:N-acetylglucosaminyldiphosphoundecaprenol N-acetyl-beta-D-mannosaminyltransferase
MSSPAADGSTAPSVRSSSLLGIRLSVVDTADVLRVVDHAVQTRTKISVTFLNPTYVMAARRDPALSGLINRFDLVLADGWGVVYGARLLGVAVPDRLANDDVGPDLFRLSAERGWRTFLFGSEPGVAEQAAASLTRQLPGLPVSGTRHGWWDVLRGHPGRFDPADARDAVDAVNAAGTDVLWVGLPTPLQQRWVTSYRDQLEAPVVITGGAYLDHLTGDMESYYPAWAMRFKLCWLYKVWLEPRRVWRRYTVEMAQYARLLARERVRMLRRSRRGLG